MGISSDRLVRWGCVSALTIAGLWIGWGCCEPAIAQSRIEANETLGSDRSVVTPFVCFSLGEMLNLPNAAPCESPAL